MDIYQAIATTIQAPPQSEAEAQSLLNRLSEKVQTQLIAAIYLGRDHLHHNEMRIDRDRTVNAIDKLITREAYARTLYEKASAGASKTYLETLLKCAKASEFDLNTM